MSGEFEEGDRVKWKWGPGEGSGTRQTKYTSRVTRKVKGKEITRNASEEEPAYLIHQEDGDRVLKSGSELHRA